MKEDIRYIINKKAGMVICVLSGCKYIACKRVFKYTHYYNNFLWKINNTFVGVAKCAPEDEWDEEFGKKLAFFRARKKRNKAINNAVNEAIKTIENEVETLKKYGIHKELEWEE